LGLDLWEHALRLALGGLLSIAGTALLLARGIAWLDW